MIADPQPEKAFTAPRTAESPEVPTARASKPQQCRADSVLTVPGEAAKVSPRSTRENARRMGMSPKVRVWGEGIAEKGESVPRHPLRSKRQTKG